MIRILLSVACLLFAAVAVLVFQLSMTNLFFMALMMIFFYCCGYYFGMKDPKEFLNKDEA